MWPRYITDMHAKTWEELQAGNIAVTKNDIPFISFGADHACRHLNKLMKIHSGLVCISYNANARQRFFTVAPDLSCCAEQFKIQFDMEPDESRQYHDSVVKKEHAVIDKIKAAILKQGNPFAIEGDRMHNVILMPTALMSMYQRSLMHM